MLTIKLDIKGNYGYNYLRKERVRCVNSMSAERLVRKVNSKNKLANALSVCNFAITVFSVIVFACMLTYFATRSLAMLLGCIVTLGAPFVVVSLLRRIINAPRPYEIYDFLEKSPENKVGNSFPSRHSFSVFAIGTLCLFASVPVGVVTLVLGVLLCFCRVALGLHFVRDVVVGGAIGIITSLIGGFILI